MDMLSLPDLLTILEEIENFHSQRSQKRWSVAMRQAINRLVKVYQAINQLSEQIEPKPENEKPAEPEEK
jgi:hypothetical protein